MTGHFRIPPELPATSPDLSAREPGRLPVRLPHNFIRTRRKPRVNGAQAKGTVMPTTDTTLSDTLFDLAIGDDEPRARKSDPETSHLAADDSRKNQRIVQDAVFGHLLLAPSTDEELTDWYFSTPGLPPAHRDSPRKRRSDLAKAGKLLATTVQRPTSTGSLAVVWAVAVAQ